MKIFSTNTHVLIKLPGCSDGIPAMNLPSSKATIGIPEIETIYSISEAKMRFIPNTSCRGQNGPLNEHLPEIHCCGTSHGRGNENICPEDEETSPVAPSKRSRKDGGLNLRKSLAWNPAFFTEEGVLDLSELSTITDSVTKPSNKLLSNTNVEGSSTMQFDKFSKRPHLNYLECNFLSKVHARTMSRSSNKRAANLSSISEASKHDEPQASTNLRKTPSTKAITRNARKLDVACLMLEKEKTAKVQLEKVTSVLKLNSCPSSSNRSQREMSCSAPTGMTCLVKEKAQNYRTLPPAPIQAKQSTLRIPSSHGSLEKEKTSKPLFETDPILLKLNSSPSSSTRSPMETACSGSIEIFSSISQRKFNVPGLPPAPIQAKPSSLRMPSPSLGFFQQKVVTPSHSDQHHRISQVHISNTPSLRKPANLKRIAPSKPPVAQTEQQPKKGTVPTKTNVYLGKSRSTTISFTTKGSNLALSDFEAHTDIGIKQLDKKGTISSNVCGTSNCLSDGAKEIMTNCLSVSHNMDKKTPKVLQRKPYTGRATERELTDESCSNSQISSKPLTEGNGMLGKIKHVNRFENTSGFSRSSGGSIATEICPASSEMHFPQNIDESNSKQLCVRAPVMNGELVMLKDAGDDTLADVSLEKLHCISAVCGASEETSLYIEPRKDPTDDFSVQNGEENFLKTRSEFQQTISGKSQTGEVHASFSQHVQLAPSEEYHPQDVLRMCESRNETSSVEENKLMPAKKMPLDNSKQDTSLLKHHSSAVPYSEEWLAAIEAFGEDILEVKTGTVHNSPPDKDILERGPWSPVKRKAQEVGPFDCTKYTVKLPPWEK